MNKKLIKTISVACGCTAICGVGIGGLVYSTFNGTSAPTPTPTPDLDPDKFVEKQLPIDLLNINDNNVLTGFKSDISDDAWASYKEDGYNTLFIPKNVSAINQYAFTYFGKSFITSIHFEQTTDSLSLGTFCFDNSSYFTRLVIERPILSFGIRCFGRLNLNIIKFYGSTNWLDTATFSIQTRYNEGPFDGLPTNGTIICRNGGDADYAKQILEEKAEQSEFATWSAVNVD